MSKTTFWDRAEDVNAGMLDMSDGERLVPMSHYTDRANHTLWFITAADTQAAEEVAAGPKSCGYVLCDNGKGLYAHLKGSLALSNDRARLEELWNTVADSWFDGGIDDPDLRLLAFTLTGGEVWITPTSGIRFIFNVTKAQLTGDRPDMGEHFTL